MSEMRITEVLPSRGWIRTETAGVQGAFSTVSVPIINIRQSQPLTDSSLWKARRAPLSCCYQATLEKWYSRGSSEMFSPEINLRPFWDTRRPHGVGGLQGPLADFSFPPFHQWHFSEPLKLLQTRLLFFSTWRIVWIGHSNKQPSQGTRKVALRRDEWSQSGNRIVAILSWATLEAGFYAFLTPSPG